MEQCELEETLEACGGKKMCISLDTKNFQSPCTADNFERL